MPIVHAEEWKQELKSCENDPYTREIIMTSEKIMEELDNLDDDKINAFELLSKHGKELTGFMAAAVAVTVEYFHSKGELFRKSFEETLTSPKSP